MAWELPLPTIFDAVPLAAQLSAAGTAPCVVPMPDPSDAVAYLVDESRPGATMTAGAELFSLLAGLDLLPFAIIIVERDATVRRTNRAAADVLRSGRDLGVSGRRLQAARPLDTGTLRHAVADVALRAAGHPGVLITRVWRPRANGGFAAVIVARGEADHPRTALVTVMAFDAARLPALDVSVLRTLHDLTPAEARIAALLAAGQGATAISRLLRISLNTARTHIHRVLAKVGCTRQADLVRVLLSGIAPLRSTGGLNAPYDAAIKSAPTTTKEKQ